MASRMAIKSARVSYGEEDDVHDVETKEGRVVANLNVEAANCKLPLPFRAQSWFSLCAVPNNH